MQKKGEEIKYRAWLPMDILNKAIFEYPNNPANGGDVSMILGGIASTNSVDLDGDILDPNGFDLSYFNKNGVVNWNHGKNPNDVIGTPRKAEIKEGKLHVEVSLFNKHEKAQQVYLLAKDMTSTNRKLGFSIEGLVLAKDKKNPSLKNKVLITNIAITPNPKNSDSTINIIEKGEIEIEPFETQNFIVDVNGEIIEKSINTTDNAGIVKEDLEGKNSLNNKKNVTMQTKKTKSKAAENVDEIDEKDLKFVKEDGSNEDADGDGDNDDEYEDNDDDGNDDEKVSKAVSAELSEIKELLSVKFKQVGEIMKGFSTLVTSLSEKVEELEKGVGDSLKEISTSLADEMEELHKSIDSTLDAPQGRKSVTTARAVERFEKSVKTDDDDTEQKTISISREKNSILKALDHIVAQPGINIVDAQMLRKGTVTLESGNYIERGVKEYLKQKYNIVVVE